MPTLPELMRAAVSDLGGTARPGQEQMAQAVLDAVDTGEHLLVQAGTGTGKSLGYLVPAILHAHRAGTPVVVATATLALQGQIVDRDLPRLAGALAPLLGRRPTYALVKGRRNYVCLHKLEGGFPDEEEALFDTGDVDAAAGRLGQEVVRVREWAQETESGDRDELVPGVSERAWRQVSVSAEECLGSRCPMAAECFVERARAAAHDVDIIVTNHSFLAIDALEGRFMLPEHDLLVIDEGHELVERITSTITDELTPGMIRRAARRARSADSAEVLEDSALVLERTLEALPEERLTAIPEAARPGPRDGARQRARGPERAQAEAGGDGRRREAGRHRRRRRGLRHQCPHARGARARRAVESRRPPARCGALRRPDERGHARAREDLPGAHRRAHLRHPGARGHLRRARRHDGAAGPGRPALSRPRRRQPLQLCRAGHRLCRRAPAGARPGLLIGSGLDVKVVQARLRHKNATTTLRTYAHLWPDTDESARAAVAVVLAARADSLRTEGVF
ncbi:MAG: hypothetical protein KDB28_09080 [Tetrasphaera sp.]|nr:hypothetical protein [Tetrasphaera sp.]